MAVVTLAGLWLNVAGTPSTYDSFDTTGVNAAPSRPTDIRRYAGGRLRLITRPGTQQLLKVNLSQCSRAQINELQGWIGTLLCVRDQTGRKFYGAYGSVDIAENGFADFADVSLTLAEVTYSEAV